MNIDVEWLDAPGVRDRVLAATWARLSVEVSGSPLFDAIHLASETRRRAVYGPVFPLVAWLVENWWSLLYEPCSTSPLRAGRHAPPQSHQWLRRHSLLAAREGTALPDATLVRDGDDVVFHWVPDSGDTGGAPLRFIGTGQARVHLDAFQSAAARLIQMTLERVRAVLGDDDEVGRLEEAWSTIQSAPADERELCRSLALLGVDPYDPVEASDALIAAVAELNQELPQPLRDDLFEASSPATLAACRSWLQKSRVHLAAGAESSLRGLGVCRWDASAHQTGYRLARELRRVHLGLTETEAIADLEGLLVERLGWDPDPLRPLHEGMQRSSIEGLIGWSRETCKPVFVDATPRSPAARRFQLARSVFFTFAVDVGDGRLVTRAVTRAQRASRAFAAELLAPAAALTARLSGSVSQDDISELAQDFGVNPVLVQHQATNHGLGMTLD